MAALVRLDSSREDERCRQWSQPLGPAKMILRCEASGVAALREMGGRERQTWGNPLEAIRWLGETQQSAGAKTRWVGYISYDLGRYFEQLPVLATDDLQLPLFVFTLHDYAPVAEKLEPSAARPQALALGSNFTREQYLKAVQRALDYIADGDIFQVNLAQRFTATCPMPARMIYQRIQENFPAWYAALLDYGDFALACNSPELFLQVGRKDMGQRTVLTRPIKGTRPRQAGMENELLHSIKDQAELNMIIDLERNDLGRICHTGSVRVTQPRMIEMHPTVFHGAATVAGVLREEVTLLDLLAATFPGGSITGAPKIRAMQIIEELEPQRRGPYCGAIGYLDGDGSMLLNIAIRTMILAGGKVHVPVGGGIVADSRPELEYEETLVKAQAAFRVLGVNSPGEAG